MNQNHLQRVNSVLSNECPKWHKIFWMDIPSTMSTSHVNSCRKMLCHWI